MVDVIIVLHTIIITEITIVDGKRFNTVCFNANFVSFDSCVFATWADALNFGIIKADRNRKRWVMCFIDFKYKN